MTEIQEPPVHTPPGVREEWMIALRCMLRRPAMPAAAPEGEAAWRALTRRIWP